MNDGQLDQVGQILELLKFERISILILGIVLLIFISKFISRAGESLGLKFTNKRLFILQIVTILNFAVYVLGLPLLIYGVLRPPKELLIALGGSVAVAVGFAIKDVVASFVSGVVMLFDRPAHVGDRITVGDVYGEVKSIGLRAVKLVTLDDNVVTIPNSKLVSDQVSSGNFGALDMMVVVNFHTSLNENIDHVIEILREVVVTSRYAYLAKPVNVVVKEVEVGMKLALRFSVKAYVLDVHYEKAFETDIVTRVSEVFKEQNIERP
ncbi:MAG: mechanosensitive ion channel protein [Halobacteriovoraceae bacterium]|nr:mechanosensitive ion channel protein [Halobacteriovoraceae bacterium]|tara:strand:+ start:154709 stop:155506 length:798 start_codon:yes stop_codon:yes gene_type:complete